MAVIPGVSDGELIRTTWGDAVADELNTNTVKKTGASDDGRALTAPDVLLSDAQSAIANAVTRRDYVDD